MPIRPELRHFYNNPKWARKRRLILRRARNRCEQCGKRNGSTIYVSPARDRGGRPIQYWVLAGGRVWRQSPSGRRVNEFKIVGLPRKVKVILCLAHKNHLAGDDRPKNLLALCQWCHLEHDREKHREARRIRIGTLKDSRRPLLAELEPPPAPPMAKEKTLRFRCVICDHLSAGRKMFGSLIRFPRRHYLEETGGLCPGTQMEAEWVEV